jgi:hypothetical protein
MITVMLQPDEPTRTASKPCSWVAECCVDDVFYRGRSRNAAANELARVMVAAGVPDDEMQTVLRSGMPVMHYRSFHAAAKWTYQESATNPVHRVRYVPPDQIAAARRGETPKQGVIAE